MSLPRIQFVSSHICFRFPRCVESIRHAAFSQYHTTCSLTRASSGIKNNRLPRIQFVSPRVCFCLPAAAGGGGGPGRGVYVTSSPIASQSRGTSGGKSGRVGRLMRTARRVLTRRPKLRPRGAIVQLVGGRNISYALCDVTAASDVASCSARLASPSECLLGI